MKRDLEDLSRKGAKAQSATAFQRVFFASLRLCARIFFFLNVMRIVRASIADFSQDDSHESEQFVERVKSCCLTRCDVFNLAFKKATLDVSVGTKLDYESSPGLPSVHEKRRMDQT